MIYLFQGQIYYFITMGSVQNRLHLLVLGDLGNQIVRVCVFNKSTIKDFEWGKDCLACNMPEHLSKAWVSGPKQCLYKFRNFFP